MSSSLSRELHKRAAASGNAVALETFTIGTLTYADWNRRAGEIAAALRNIGVARGERVSVVLSEQEWSYYVCAIIGIQRAGATPVTANPRNVGRRLQSVLHDAGASVALVAGEFDGFSGQALNIGSLCSEKVIDDTQSKVAAEILLTSGSTGAPKAVLCDHSDLAFDRTEHADYGFSRTGEVHVSYTATGSNAAQRKLKSMILRSGLEHVVLPYFDPTLLAEAIDARRATRVSLIPSTAASVVRSDFPWAWDTGSVTHVFVSSALSPPSLLNDLSGRFPNARLINSYGLTEGGNAGIWGEYDPRHPRVVGRPTPDTEIRILRDGHQPESLEEDGELLVRVKGMKARTYLDGTSVADAEGWIHTGDRARVTDQGEIEILGRCDDQINVGGFRLDRQVVEDVLLRCDDLADAGVAIVRGDRDWIGAAVVLKEPSYLDNPGQFRAYLGRELGDAARYVRVIAVDSVPRTSTGKTAQLEIVTLLRANQIAVGGPYTPECELVLGAARQILRNPTLEPDDDFFDSGLDSLLALELVSEIADRADLEDDLDFWVCFDNWTARLLASHLTTLLRGARELSDGGIHVG